MLNIMNQIVKIAIFGVLLAISLTASASHHFESEFAAASPVYDLTDVYVFPSERSDHTVFIANINPNVEPGGVSPFADDGLYNLHIGKDQALTNGMTLTFQFTGNTGRVGLVAGANEDVGTRGEAIGEVTLGKSTIIDKGLKVWVGAIRDPFMGNCVGLARQHVSVRSGKFNPNVYDNKVDFFEPRTVGSIVVEVPNTMLGDHVYFYATSAKYDGHNWIQINRLANPLITHIFMHFDVQNTLEHVSQRPDSDDMRTSAISGHVLRMVTMGETHKHDAIAYTDGIVKRLLPDLIGYAVGESANYSAGSMGGRGLADDVMDEQISLFWGKKMTDGANDNADRFQAGFPYVIALSTLSDGKPPGFDQRPGCAP